MSKFTVVVCDHIHQSGLDILSNEPKINLIVAADEPKDKLVKDIIPQAKCGYNSLIYRCR